MFYLYFKEGIFDKKITHDNKVYRMFRQNMIASFCNTVHKKAYHSH